MVFDFKAGDALYTGLVKIMLTLKL